MKILAIISIVLTSIIALALMLVIGAALSDRSELENKKATVRVASVLFLCMTFVTVTLILILAGGYLYVL